MSRIDFAQPFAELGERMRRAGASMFKLALTLQGKRSQVVTCQDGRTRVVER